MIGSAVGERRPARPASGSPHEHRREHHRAHAGPAGEGELPPHPFRRADQVRDVQRPPARLARRVLDRAETGLDPRLERAERMVGEPVIVLDDVEAGPGEGRAERRQLLPDEGPSA